MIPYKAKTSYVQIASEMSLDPNDVKVINQFYWKFIRNQLSDLVNPIIFLTGLGTMEIKHWRINRVVERLEKKVQKWSDTSKGSAIYDGYVNDLNKVLNMRTMLNTEAENRLSTKTKRELYEHEKCNKDLEK